MKTIVQFLTLSICFFISTDLHAQSKVWNGSASTVWSTAANWTPAVVPVAADSVVIPNVTNQPTLSAATPAVMHVRIHIGATLTLSGTSKLNIDGTTSNSQVEGMTVFGSLIVAGITDTIDIRNTSSDGIGVNGGSFQNDGVIITDMTTFKSIGLFNTTSAVNNGEIWCSNNGGNGLFIDDNAAFVNNGLIDVRNCGSGIAQRDFDGLGGNSIQNFGEIRIGEGVINSLASSNFGGPFTNEQCAIFSVESRFGNNTNTITNHGLINYNATTNLHTGTYTDDGFQYDPNSQLADGTSTILTQQLTLQQFNYNLDGDGETLCADKDLDDLPGVNDRCAGAIDYVTAFGALPIQPTCSNTDTIDLGMYGNADQTVVSCDGNLNEPNAWYTWTATDSVLYFSSRAGLPGLWVLEGSCGNFTEIACLNNESGVISGLDIDSLYYFMIWQDASIGSAVEWSLSIDSLPSYNFNPICGDTLDYPFCDFSYTNNDNQTFTICPVGPDTASITFTHFDLETCCDFVEITDDGVSLGSFNGTSLIDSTFTASDTGHCLEVIFTSDASVVKTGFTFVVNCASNDTCGGAYFYDAIFGPIGSLGSCPGNQKTLDMSGYTDAKLAADGGPTCDGGGDAAAWYTWKATHNALRFESGAGEPGLELLQGSCGSFTSLGCLTNESGNIVGLDIDSTYYVVIWDDNIPGASEVSWCLEGFNPPVNDTCGGAIDYVTAFGALGSCPANQDTLDMVNYTDIDQLGFCTSGTSAWYTWKATHEVLSFTPGDGAIVFELLEGNCDNFSLLVCLNQSGLVSGLEIDSTYYIQITNEGDLGDTMTWCLEGLACSGNLVTSIEDSGVGSLRLAIACATSGDTIRFDPSIDGDTIQLLSQIRIDSSLVILGNGEANTIIDGSLDSLSRLFTILDTCTMQGITFQNGGGPTFNAFAGACGVYGPTKFVKCSFRGNRSREGGVVDIYQTSCRFDYCTFYDNHATQQGGAIHIEDATCHVVNSLFYENSAGTNGGAIAIVDDGNLDCYNSTIVRNSAASTGGGISVDNNLNILYNTIVSGNTAPVGNDIDNAGTIVDVQYNIIGDTVGLSPSTGLIVGFPTFLDTMMDNYQLADTSIGIDAGEASLLPADTCDVDGDMDRMEAIDIDLIGNPRVEKCALDIGVFENQSILFCPAINDECDNAIALPPITSSCVLVKANTHIATSSGPNSCFSGNDLWYSFIAPASGAVEVEFVPGPLNEPIARSIWSSCDSVLSPFISCDLLVHGQSIDGLTPDSTYVMMVAAVGYYGGLDSFQFCLKELTCPRPESVLISNATRESTTISWTNGSPFVSNTVVRVCPADSAADNAACLEFNTNSIADSLIVTGLSPCTDYDAYLYHDCVVPDSSATTGPVRFSTVASDVVFAPVCGDSVAYPGCPDGLYSNNEFQTFTICPSGNDTASISFTYFDLESTSGGGVTGQGCFDFVEIFDDGVSLGTYCSEADGDGDMPSNPASDLSIHHTFIASDTGHCLTVVFDSDGSVRKTGFEFVVNNCLCPPIRFISGAPAAGSFFADTTITSDGLIESPKGVIYQAGNEILLNTPFEVELGAEFDAQIGDCP